MDQFVTILFVYILPISICVGLFFAWSKYRSYRAEQRREQSIRDGLIEPVSLHPVIDHSKCIGCGTCVMTCPEGEILGVINRKAHLVSPASCIGHGACKSVCPVEAISLVFGSETRGVDIPNVTPEFETNVPGLYIAGELGGMGLIRNAIQQGVEAVDNIQRAHLKGQPHNFDYDVLVVGAGPAGISAGMSAIAKKLSYALLEQGDSVGGTLAHYPRGKLVMTRPAVLPLVGEFQFEDTNKEALVEFWEGAVNKTGLRVRTGTNVNKISQDREGFRVATSRGEFSARTVVLALGRRGTPRTLDVPGEELSKVVYRLIDAQQYENKRVLIVGGGDSAMEAAVSLSEQEGCTVSIAYRGQAFSNGRQQNRQRISSQIEAGDLEVFLESQVKQITDDTVTLNTPDGEITLANDVVIVCAGGVLPTALLETAGIDFETKYGTA